MALAQACEIAACDGASPLSAWVSALGGLGSVQGDTNASTLTYNFGGAAAGIDYRFDPRFLVGIGAGYTHGTQWVNSFLGQGWTDSVSVAAYGSFTQVGLLCRRAGGLRLLQQPAAAPDHDPRPAAAHRQRQHRRQPVPRPGRGRLQDRRLRAGRRDHHAVRPLPDLERDAERASPNRAPTRSASTWRSRPPTRSARPSAPISPARSGSATSASSTSRSGWAGCTNIADTGRPITAAFAGAPANSFTVFGATPQRDAAVVGFSASTNIAAATQLYLRYDGEVASGTDNHALTAGLREAPAGRDDQ